MKHELKPGALIEIDVANTEVIVLTLTVRRGRFHEMPSVKVEEEYSGFESTIRSITLTSTESRADGSTLDSYEIAVEWAPGADQSGSTIAVTYPDTGKVAQAKLYMLGP